MKKMAVFFILLLIHVMNLPCLEGGYSARDCDLSRLAEFPVNPENQPVDLDYAVRRNDPGGTTTIDPADGLWDVTRSMSDIKP